ncbi:MAG: hypothetical protein COV74_08805 [Candidatus Omnitrophica bacterium CG11_big_fil_rev_8_21_14_0_20_45_26]|uniref:Uncharacterized protein n=1 Tax=Candidatus Abzuiibacterium crystallinum TaxID=1974748 RepID=A0A2H0LLV9_9BACT|nr:MAG: hypothetical protein COV74_08805 [Candidatus Omnitrophica bacterium CG11_big_fil_rev_8_21_14_0_20_45_26]PIW64416.1 MAG: hypothetical protein COW12_06150 [Candidatus Omnitrophica bacterium CG12_big_fil_rev_8_21_14_0_65_45_16]
MTEKRPEQLRGYTYDELHQSKKSMELAQRALDEAKIAYQRLTSEETDPFRKEQLASFHDMAMKTTNVPELELVKQMAFRAAERTREGKTIAQQRNKKRKLIWTVTIFVALVIVGTGFKPVYFYQMPSGEVIESEKYVGKTFVASQAKVTVQYSHSDLRFTSYPILRLVMLGFVLVVMTCLMLAKMF